MSRTRRHRLGDLQLKIMKVLWSAGEAGVGTVHEALESEGLAYTTIATMLRKMEARGLVTHREAGRRYLYRPLLGEKEASRGMIHDLVERLFEGSVTEAVSHLLESREVDREELQRIEKLLENHRNRR